MVRCRILYALALVGAVLFYIFYTGYFSWYVLVLTLVFPLFSLAVSLPGVLGCSVGLAVPDPRVRRGERAKCMVRFSCRRGLPVARAVVTLEAENLLTGEKKRFKNKFSGGAESAVQREVECPHCGCVTFRVKSFRVCDLLGLFTFFRPKGAGVEVLVLPTALPDEPAPDLAGRQGAGVSLVPRPGGGPGEDYDLRPYRAGDAMRSVHWKLSSKLDELVVRETLEARRPLLLLTFDRWGPVAALDGVFSRLEAVSRWLLERELPHYVQWLEPEKSQPRQCYIENEEGLWACLRAACAAPVPRSGPSMLDLPAQVAGAEGEVRRMHLSPEEDGEGAEE